MLSLSLSLPLLHLLYYCQQRQMFELIAHFCLDFSQKFVQSSNGMETRNGSYIAKAIARDYKLLIHLIYIASIQVWLLRIKRKAICATQKRASSIAWHKTQMQHGRLRSNETDIHNSHHHLSPSNRMLYNTQIISVSSELFFQKSSVSILLFTSQCQIVVN